MSTQELYSNGYQYHKEQYKPYTDALFQKCVTDPDNRVMYFIDIYRYPPKDYGNGNKVDEHLLMEVSGNNGSLFQKACAHELDLETIEALAYRFWVSFGEYYE